MRFLISIPIVLSTLTVFPQYGHAQDAGQMAAQQAMQANQMAMQQAQQANQQASQAAMQASQQATQQASQQAASQSTTWTEGNSPVFKPSFSVKPGSYATAITLRMKDRSRGTTIYYTTDGWTPTTLSTRYTGPITLTTGTRLQAVAVTANNLRSLVATADYTIAGSTPTLTPAAISTNFPPNAPGSPLLMPGTALPLVFTAPVTSHGMQVGDKLPIALAQDLVVGGQVIAAKGTPVFATVSQVDNPGFAGAPGTLSFEVHSLTLKSGATLLLSGTETKEGASRLGKAMAAGIVPGGILLVHGQGAMIEAGAALVAKVESSPMTPTDAAASAVPASAGASAAASAMDASTVLSHP
jgi:hypothetical protein